MSAVEPDGSSFRTRDIGHAVTTSDPWFRPVDIKLGPDGALYIADWYDRQINHYRNHEGQIDPSSGRIYRLRAKPSVGASSPPGPQSSRDDRPGQAPLPTPTAGSARRPCA